jgi:hypothetical protein
MPGSPCSAGEFPQVSTSGSTGVVDPNAILAISDGVGLTPAAIFSPMASTTSLK